MPLGQDDQVIQALPPEGADDAFGDGVGPWGADRRQERLDAKAAGSGHEVAPVGRVAVTD